MGKTLSEKTFDIGSRGLTVECRSERTRYGFRHLAFAYQNGCQVGKSKACYYNRTWESFEFQSVLRGVASRLPKEDEAAVREFAEKYQAPNPFKFVAALVAMNSLTARDQKEANAVNSRIVAAIPGIEMPDNWAGLPEEVKAERLKGAVEVLTK